MKMQEANKLTECFFVPVFAGRVCEQANICPSRPWRTDVCLLANSAWKNRDKKNILSTSSSYSRNPGRFWSCWDGRSGCGNIAACGGFDYNCGNSNLGAISLVVDYHHRHHRSASTSSSRGGGNCKRCCSAWWICSCGCWFRYKEKAREPESSDRRAGSSGDQKPIHSSNQSFLVQLGQTCARAWKCLAPMESGAGCWGYVMWDKPWHVWRIEPGNSSGYVTHVEEIWTHSGGPDIGSSSWRCFGFWRRAFETGTHTRGTWRWLPLHDLPRPTVQRSFAAMWALGNLWSVLSAASSSWLQLPRLPASGWKGGKRWEYLMGVFVSFWEADGRQSVVILPCKDTVIFKCARTDLYPRCHSGSFQSESITSANQNRWKQVQRAACWNIMTNEPVHVLWAWAITAWASWDRHNRATRTLWLFVSQVRASREAERSRLWGPRDRLRLI